MRNIHELPMADAGLEAYARRLFSLDLTPDEYAARHAQDWGCFSMDEYRYSDPRLEAWVHRLGDIFFKREGAPTIEDLRRRYLTEEERRAVEARELEEF
jgi:hypothetical protein